MSDDVESRFALPIVKMLQPFIGAILWSVLLAFLLLVEHLSAVTSYSRRLSE